MAKSETTGIGSYYYKSMFQNYYGGILSFNDKLEPLHEVYYIGIIDILQYYNARKMGETVIKKAAGGDADNISCVDPETYGKRFIKFIGDLVE